MPCHLLLAIVASLSFSRRTCGPSSGQLALMHMVVAAVIVADNNPVQCVLQCAPDTEEGRGLETPDKFLLFWQPW